MIRDKQKADAIKAAARLARRRGYAKAGRERARALSIQQDGLQDLPIETQVAMGGEAAETPAPVAPEPAKPADASVEDLVTRLTAIRERLFWLQAVWATTLSHDIYQEADRYRDVFRELGDQLRAKDPAEFDKLTVGHEALLLAEPSVRRPTLPLAAQRWFELAGELQCAPVARVAPKPDGYVSDGLQSFL